MPIPTTLLVIEPHENLRDAYASVLRFAGYRVDEAACSVSAHERLLSAKPRLVLVNAHLPTAEDVMRLLRRYRSDPAFSSTTWVAVCESGAALNMPEQREFDAVLHTPISYADLIGVASAFATGSTRARSAAEPLGEPCFS